MNNIITKIDEELKGEQLLFAPKTEYTKEEQTLIIKAIDERINADFTYGPVIYFFLPKIQIILEKGKIEEKDRATANNLGLFISKMNKLSYDEIIQEIDYSLFIEQLRYNYQAFGSYQEMIKSLLNVHDIKEAYNNNNAFDKYHDNIQFLATNNLLLRRYPEFFSEEDLCQLREVATKKDRKQFDNLEDYRNFKKIAKLVLAATYKNKDEKKVKVKK